MKTAGAFPKTPKAMKTAGAVPKTPKAAKSKAATPGEPGVLETPTKECDSSQRISYSTKKELFENRPQDFGCTKCRSSTNGCAACRKKAGVCIDGSKEDGFAWVHNVW